MGRASAAGISGGRVAPAGILARGFADDSSLLKTAMYDTHVASGGEEPTDNRRAQMARRWSKYPTSLVE